MGLTCFLRGSCWGKYLFPYVGVFVWLVIFIKNKFIYLFIFIFGCIGSSLLHAGFL